MAEGAIQGLPELHRKLLALGDVTGPRVLRSAARAAMKPVSEAARASAPVGSEVHQTYRGRTVTPGFTQRSIRMVASIDRATKAVRVFLGVLREAFYALAFVEKGTSKMPARPWLVPTFERMKNSVLADLGRRLKSGIERAAKKRGR